MGGEAAATRPLDDNLVWITGQVALPPTPPQPLLVEIADNRVIVDAEDPAAPPATSCPAQAAESHHACRDPDCWPRLTLTIMFDAPTELRHLAEYDFERRNEAEIRGDWIDPFLRLLGYGLGTRHRILRETRLRLDPAVRMLGSSRYEIDYVPTVFGHRLWIIEAKKPADDLFSDAHLGQAWSYATDPRVAVPLIMLCDGTRLGVFDVTTETWTTPVLDVAKADLASAFDDVFALLGAPRVAERVRLRQLEYLRGALEAQVDLDALDKTVQEVKQIVDDVRPTVLERRRQIRDEARERVSAKGEAARDAVGMWGHAQHINEPMVGSWHDIIRAVEIVRDADRIVRVREFDDIERSTTPRGEAHSRMWFSLRAVRLGCAVLLADDDGCGEYCERAARDAALAHATGFAGDDLGRAAYRVQRAIGRMGWRMAATTHPLIEEWAAKLVEQLEPEEWLRRDGEMGLTAEDHYMRTARLLPRMLVARLQPWTPEHLTSTAEDLERQLELLPKPGGFDDWQPATDPWLESWKDGDPLRDLSIAILRATPGKSESPKVAELARQLLALFDEGQQLPGEFQTAHS